MPTGYTVLIENKEDLTLEEFALHCAGIETYSSRRQADTSYHKQNLEDISKKLIDVSQMSHEEIMREAELRLWWTKKQYDLAAAKYDELNVRYARMREKVEAWDPPTSKHTNLKTLMLEQIDNSKPNDPRSYFPDTARLDPKEAMVGFDPEAWRLSQYEELLKDMEYHQHRQALVDEEIKKQELWAQKLRESVKGR